MTDDLFSHLGLREWPCQIHPDPSFYEIWADRKEVYTQFDRLFRSLSRIPMSQIFVVWGWYGTGKTHALHHFRIKSQNQYPSVLTNYCSIPFNRKLKFIDIYRQLMIEDNVVFDAIQNAYIARKLKGDKKAIKSKEWRSFEAGLRALAEGGEYEAELATDWLKGENIHLNKLKQISVNKRIETDDDALRAITEIRKLLDEGRAKHLQWIMILDEFQNVFATKNSDNIQKQINQLMTQNPKGLTLILSCTMDDKASLRNMLSSEIRNKFLASRGTLDVPPFTMAKAYEFVEELFQQFRCNSPECKNKIQNNVWFPFSKEAIKAILEFVDQDVELRLVPRGIMKVLDYIMRNYEEEIASENLTLIEEEHVSKILPEITSESD